MKIPPRTKMKSSGSSQDRTLLYLITSLNITLAVMFVLIGFRLHFSLTIINAGVIAFIIFPFLIGVILGFRYRTQQYKILEQNGYKKIKPKNFDPELKSVCSTGTFGFHNEPCTIAFIGSSRNRKVMISEHLHESLENTYRSLSTRWAIWTPFELPFAFVGPKSLWVDYERTLGHDEFDRVRSLSTRNESKVRELLLPLVDWFVPQNKAHSAGHGTRMCSKKETWLFDGHWILLADYGRTDAQGKLRMVEFLTTFVEQLELQLSQS